MESEFFKTINDLCDLPNGVRLVAPQKAADVGQLPYKTQELLAAVNPIVESTNQALKYILEKNGGKLLAVSAPDIIATHEAIYESKSIDKKTGDPRILLVKIYPNGKDLFAVVEIKMAGAKNQLVTVARVGDGYLEALRKIL